MFFKRGAASATPGAPPSANLGSPRSAGLANFAVPPFPTPLPHRLISLHVTPSGIVIAPRSSPDAHHASSTAAAAAHTRTRSRSDSISLAQHTDDGAVQDVAHDARRIARSHATLGASPEAGAKVGWGKKGKVEALTPADVKSALASSPRDEGNEILAYGVLGLLRVFNEAYLFVVTSRTQAGDFLHPSLPVYRCSGVMAIPLSRSKAQAAFREELARQAKVPAANVAGSSDESDTTAEDSDGDVVTPSIIGKEEFFQKEMARPQLGQTASATLRPQKVRMWLGRKERAAISESGEAGLTEDQGQDESEGGGAEKNQTEQVDLPEAATETVKQLTSDQRWHEANKAELEDKVVKETARQYARGAMWFSYDFDLFTSIQRKQELCEEQAAPSKRGSSSATTTAKAKGNALPFEEPNRTLPLWRRVDRRFWHNEALSRDFVDAGIHSLILPVMQGYFQVTSLPIDLAPGSPLPTSDVAGDAMEAVSAAASSERIEASLLLVSRRSKERAGLRYQRRGIDDEGHVANFVETEQVLLVRRAGQVHLQTFLQWRGSIPQYWRQDPFNIKPPPILERSKDENRMACSRHFEAQVKRYGSITCINLAEQAGKEGQITEAYRSAVEDLKRPEVRYHAFDFHHVCAGMKFERVSLLIDEMKETLEEMGSFWRSLPRGVGEGGDEVLSRQKGTFRVSCLDCLDRTNVVQSAFARHVLEAQLQRVGIALPSLTNKAERDEAFDFVFNDSWANNGDAISATYAGTNALKGDFTRTGQRNFRGMMNDATNSLWRTVQGAVTDFFKQTVMDFQLGQLSLAGLERYGDELNTKDPNEGNRLRRVRANAIETCGPLVMGKDEERIAGWTLFSPVEANRVHSAKLEEKVVIMSNKALYICGYDFQSEKLAEFSRVLLGDITGMTKGLYIISPKEGYHPENHWGFTVSFLSHAEEKRLNNASMRNVPKAAAAGGAGGAAKEGFYAFRVVVDDFAGTVDRTEDQRSHPFSASNASTSASSSAAAATNGATGAKGFFKRNRSADKARPSSLSARASTSDAAPSSTVVTFASGGGGTASEDLTSHDIVDRIVSLVAEGCAAAGAFAPEMAKDKAEEPTSSMEEFAGFVKNETIQSLAQAKANASLFAPLIEGLKRRVWL